MLRHCDSPIAQSNQTQEVTQFQVLNWTPDGLCADYNSVADLIEKVTRVQRQTGNNPIVIHCRYSMQSVVVRPLVITQEAT